MKSSVREKDKRDGAPLSLRFTAELEPVPFPRPASNGRRRYNPPRYTAFKTALGLIARRAFAGLEPFAGAVRLRAEFFKLKPKNPTSRNWGDIDNHVKAVLDALNGICFTDDAQVTEIYAGKLFGEPHITIELEEL